MKTCKVIKIEESSNIDNIIKKCALAFDEPVHMRNYYISMLNKISKYADFYAVFCPNVVGYLAIYANNYIDKIAYITLIAVVPEYQNMGIGKMLLKKCEQIAVNKGFKVVRLEVKKNNTNAIMFYKRNGFNIIDDASSNSYYMEKDLKKFND